MATRLASVVVRGAKVTLKFEWTEPGVGGTKRVHHRQQITLDRAQFEKAMLGSTVEIPWTGLI